jgi:hypothetical protein
MFISIKMNILLAIDNHIYEVSNFVNKHPGEGIRNIYLNEHNRSDASLLFENIAEDYLIAARNNDHDTIKYIAPYYFIKKIPIYYHYIPNIENINLKDIPNKSFLLYQSDDDPKLSLNIFVKDAMAFISVHNLKLVVSEVDKLDKLDKCYVELCSDVDKDKKVLTEIIEDVTIEAFIDKNFKGQGYTPILKPSFN